MTTGQRAALDEEEVGREGHGTRSEEDGPDAAPRDNGNELTDED